MKNMAFRLYFQNCYPYTLIGGNEGGVQSTFIFAPQIMVESLDLYLGIQHL